MSLSDFHLMGTGEVTSPRCNTVVAVKYCSDCGHGEARYHHCHNWDCPECYFWNASDSAYDVVQRLLGVQRANAAIGKHPGRILHVTFSVPLSEWEDFRLDKARRKLYRFAKMVGIYGGAVVFHAYRIREELKVPLLDAMKGTGLIGGLWAGVHEDLLGLGSWKSYVVLGPHFHVLGFYPHVLMKSNVFYETTGWTYKAIGVTRTRNVFKTARYQLSHVAIDGSLQAITYFGVAAYNMTCVETVKTITFETCPKCGSDNYFLLRCGAHRFEQLSAGVQLIDGKFQRVKPDDSELILHVRLVKTVKFFTVRTEQAGLASFGVAC